MINTEDQGYDPDTCCLPVGGGLRCGAPIGECEHTQRKASMHNCPDCGGICDCRGFDNCEHICRPAPYDDPDC